MKESSKKLTTVAMLCALAFLMVSFRVPVVLFLKYDPKDVVVTLGGFILGPVVSVVIAVVTSLIEMITISDTGIIGCIMNIISTCAFACVASVIYKKVHNMKGALLGLGCGIVSQTLVMLLWNVLITPVFMKIPRAQVVDLLVPAFLPFNLLKSTINATITYLLYKPVVTGLRKAHLIPESKNSGKKINVGVMLVALAILATCVVIVLVLNGKI